MLRIPLIAALLALLPIGAIADETKIGDLTIAEPWARATIGQGKTGAAYLMITNHGISGDRLVAAATPAARAAHLHIHKIENGVMKMRRLDAVEVKSHATTAFKPGGLHIMLMGLHRPLREGESFPLSLTFEKAGKVSLVVSVAGATAKQAAHARGHGDGHKTAQAHGSHAGGHKMGHGHAAKGHDHSNTFDVPAGPSAPALELTVLKDKVGGWNLYIETKNFRFAPERVNQAHVPGEGHAHLYVNGKKVAQIYGSWFHIGALPKGANTVEVTLNTNDHSTLTVGGEPLTKSLMLHAH